MLGRGGPKFSELQRQTGPRRGEYHFYTGQTFSIVLIIPPHLPYILRQKVLVENSHSRLFITESVTSQSSDNYLYATRGFKPCLPRKCKFILKSES